MGPDWSPSLFCRKTRAIAGCGLLHILYWFLHLSAPDPFFILFVSFLLCDWLELIKFPAWEVMLSIRQHNIYRRRILSLNVSIPHSMLCPFHTVVWWLQREGGGTCKSEPWKMHRCCRCSSMLIRVSREAAYYLQGYIPRYIGRYLP